MAFNISQLFDYRRIWLQLPIAPARKESIRQCVFTKAPLLFRWSSAYKDRAAVYTPLEIVARAIQGDHRAAGRQDNYSVQKLDGAEPQLPVLQVGAITFYPPGFIPSRKAISVGEKASRSGSTFTKATTVLSPVISSHSLFCEPRMNKEWKNVKNVERITSFRRSPNHG